MEPPGTAPGSDPPIMGAFIAIVRVAPDSVNIGAGTAGCKWTRRALDAMLEGYHEGTHVMKILLVLAHPRQTSLCHAAARAFADAATDAGHQIDWADLAAERFDPVLHEADEPDWDNPAKIYSQEVQAEMARIERNEATVMLFPVWWWSMPALLKGWIDRVWNNGWAYGGANYPHAKVQMLAVAGGDAASFAKRGYDQAMVVQLETGILRYCGVQEPSLHMLYDSFDPEGRSALLAKAAELGARF